MPSHRGHVAGVGAFGLELGVAAHGHSRYGYGYPSYYGYSGRFQHLELVPGAHQIEIVASGFAPIIFDLRAIDGRTITYRAQMVPYRP